MLKIKKLSNVAIEPIPLKKVPENRILGFEYLPEIYSNVLMLARKQSGKTTIVANLLKHCIDNRTKVFFFVGTINLDASYKEIMRDLDERGVTYEKFTDIVETVQEGKKKVRVDTLQNILNKIRKPDGESKKPAEIDRLARFQLVSCSDDLEFTVKVKKPKKVAPEYLFVFDDISSELEKNETFQTFVKQNRHYKAKVLICTQDITDITTDARRMIDNWLILGSHPESKLRIIYNYINPPCEFEDFKKLYSYCTAKPYGILHVMSNTEKNPFRLNFNTEISLD